MNFSGFFCNFSFLIPQTKVFGVSLESLPCYNVESGSVPRLAANQYFLFFFFFYFIELVKNVFISCLFRFLVDACMVLMAHVDTEGLFRKSGSVVRLKALRVSDG